MEQYEIRVTDQATRQLYDGASYISNHLKNPAAAKRLVQTIWLEVQSLDTMPFRFPCIDEE